MNILSQVDTLFAEPRKGFELEVRFGRFIRKDDGRQVFESNISPEVYYRVLNYFRSHAGNLYINHPSIIKTRVAALGFNAPGGPEITIDNLYEGGIRETHIQTITGPSPNFYISKKTIGNVNYTDYGVRFAKATETELDTPQLGKLLLTREKHRWSYTTAVSSNPLYPFIIDITRVDTLDHASGRKFQTFEIELEVYAPFKSVKADLLPGIIFMLKLIQDTRTDPLTLNTITRVISDFNKVLGLQQGPNIGKVLNKPINFKLAQLVTPNAYSITDKADGLRKALYIRNDGAYTMYPDANVQLYIRPTVSLIELNGTILDGELVDGMYLAFDILLHKGVTMLSVPFTERLVTLKSVVARLKTVKLKEYAIPNGESFYTLVNKVLDSIPSKGYDNDGLIFNTLKAAYNAKDTVYKWKPPHLLTIDFRVEPVGNGEYSILYKTAKGYALFTGTQEYPAPSTIRSGYYENGQIVECQWLGDEFVPMRVRYDKTEPNFERTVFSVYSDIRRPILESTIRGRDLVLMRKYHNILKRDLIKMYAPVGSTLLDIGSGNGGDIDKWLGNNLNVYAVEPSGMHLDEFRRRLGTNGYTQVTDNHWTYAGLQMYILQTGGEDPVIVEEYASKYDAKPECVSIFNALTFFFREEALLDALVYTLDRTTDADAHLIGMVMDGELVRKELETANGTIKDYGWEIRSLGDFTDSPYGNKVYINLDSAIVKDQTEYLVDMPTLNAKLESMGFTLVASNLASNESLSPSQNKLSSFYRSFVYKRSSLVHTPDPTARVVIVKDTELAKDTEPVKDTELVKDTEPTSMTVKNENVVYSNVPDEIYLDDGETHTLNINGLRLTRIGNINYGDCILAAAVRSSVPKYSELKGVKSRELSISVKIAPKFIEFVRKNWNTFTGLREAGAPENYTALLEKCNYWNNLPLISPLAEFINRAIVLIHDDGTIEYYQGDFKTVIIIYTHADLYDTVGYDEGEGLRTIFDPTSIFIRALTRGSTVKSVERVQMDATPVPPSEPMPVPPSEPMPVPSSMPVPPNVIKFYQKGKYFEFSNFYPSKFTIDGVVYSSVENYFQSQKFVGTPKGDEYARLVAAADSPGKTKVLGTQKPSGAFSSTWKLNKSDPRLLHDLYKQSISDGVKLRPDWESVKDDVMYKGLLAKFTQNTKLGDLLLSTGDALLVEDSPRDYYWGIGKDGSGKNMLGILLMKLRGELPSPQPLAI